MVKRLDWANALRGVAAVSVLGFHYCVVFWVAQETAASIARRAPLYSGRSGAPSIATALDRLPIDFGALGVGLFFLLSGFVIAISLERYGRVGFLVGRSLRILPTYAAGYLVSCTVISAVGDPRHELGLVHVLAGIIPGLQFLLGVSAPGDGIAWTLILELSFYGVCLIGHRQLTRRWQAIAAVAVGCVLVQWLVSPPTVLVGSSLGGLRYIVLLVAPFMPVLLVGVTLSARSRKLIGTRPAAVLVLFLVGVHVALMWRTAVVPTSLKYRLTFLGVIAAFVIIWAIGQRWHRHAVTDFIADISYPLYVVHPVLGYAMLSVLSARGVPFVPAVLATTVAATCAAWLLHLLVEAPTHRLGQRWARRLSAYSAETPVGLRVEPSVG